MSGFQVETRRLIRSLVANDIGRLEEVRLIKKEIANVQEGLVIPRGASQPS